MTKRKKAKEVVTSPVESAKAAGLRYVSDSQPGIHRRRRGTGFQYLDADGKPLRDKEALGRIRSLVIPPAWRDVWVCTNPKGHLQVTGRDARGRKQSRYHPRWREVRDETKYERMTIFGAALPGIREQVQHDLSLPEMPRRKILAAIVRLMEVTLIRVGNEEYARENHSYGLTTMRNKHVQVAGAKVSFKFQGKSGVRHMVDINDRRLARIIQRCQDIPGYELFQYIDGEGNHHSVDSADVNEYLREITEQDFTAKDFRTWSGTVMACTMLQEFETFQSQTQAKKNVVQAIKGVAERLGNTPAVCRKCYVHPAVLDTYFSGGLIKSLEKQVEEETAHAPHALRQEEVALLHLLKKRLAQVAAS
jgi:DNA topoisomerase-1